MFAFPRERKEPLVDAAHVRNSISRFDQVEGVTDEERDQAWARIRTAAGGDGFDQALAEHAPAARIAAARWVSMLT